MNQELGIMENKELAQWISDISKKELGLLYYFPEEIEEAIKENRYILLKEGDRRVGFGLWTIRANWLELHTLYIAPEFRGRGYMSKLLEVGYERLKDSPFKIYAFTRAGAVMHGIEKYGFRPGSFFDLPWRVIFGIFWHRLNPRRWPSYLKYGWKIFGAWKWELYIR